MLILDLISGKSFFIRVLFDFFDLCLCIFWVPELHAHNLFLLLFRVEKLVKLQTRGARERVQPRAKTTTKQQQKIISLIYYKRQNVFQDVS